MEDLNLSRTTLRLIENWTHSTYSWQCLYMSEIVSKQHKQRWLKQFEIMVGERTLKCLRSEQVPIWIVVYLLSKNVEWRTIGISESSMAIQAMLYNKSNKSSILVNAGKNFIYCQLRNNASDLNVKLSNHARIEIPHCKNVFSSWKRKSLFSCMSILYWTTWYSNRLYFHLHFNVSVSLNLLLHGISTKRCTISSKIFQYWHTYL